jgi:hypothetical protein
MTRGDHRAALLLPPVCWNVPGVRDFNNKSHSL